jgi:hypothetical protein
LQDTRFNLRLHLRLQTLTARIQTAAESSQAGRVWAAAQNLAELLVESFSTLHRGLAGQRNFQQPCAVWRPCGWSLTTSSLCWGGRRLRDGSVFERSTRHCTRQAS